MDLFHGLKGENEGPPKKKAKVQKNLNKRKRLKAASEFNLDSDLPKRKRKKVEEHTNPINRLPESARTEMKNRAAEVIFQESTQTPSKNTSNSGGPCSIRNPKPKILGPNMRKLLEQQESVSPVRSESIKSTTERITKDIMGFVPNYQSDNSSRPAAGSNVNENANSNSSEAIDVPDRHVQRHQTSKETGLNANDQNKSVQSNESEEAEINFIEPPMLLALFTSILMPSVFFWQTDLESLAFSRIPSWVLQITFYWICFVGTFLLVSSWAIQIRLEARQKRELVNRILGLLFAFNLVSCLVTVSEGSSDPLGHATRQRSTPLFAAYFLSFLTFNVALNRQFRNESSIRAVGILLLIAFLFAQYDPRISNSIVFQIMVFFAFVDVILFFFLIFDPTRSFARQDLLFKCTAIILGMLLEVPECQHFFKYLTSGNKDNNADIFETEE